jgi:hypothetical protein
MLSTTAETIEDGTARAAAGDLLPHRRPGLTARPKVYARIWGSHPCPRDELSTFRARGISYRSTRKTLHRASSWTSSPPSALWVRLSLLSSLLPLHRVGSIDCGFRARGHRFIVRQRKLHRGTHLRRPAPA